MKTKESIELLTCTHPDTGELITEEFRPVKGYEGKYEVSSFGRVLSLSYKRSGVPGLLSQHLSKGYPSAVFSTSDMRTFHVHKLVAIAFLDHKPSGHEEVVNHKDFNKENNKYFNLELVTQRVNSNKKHIQHTSQYTGVCWNKNRKKWKASIVIRGIENKLGFFVNEIDAHNAYQNKLIELGQVNTNHNEAYDFKLLNEFLTCFKDDGVSSKREIIERFFASRKVVEQTKKTEEPISAFDVLINSVKKVDNQSEEGKEEDWPIIDNLGNRSFKDQPEESKDLITEFVQSEICDFDDESGRYFTEGSVIAMIKHFTRK